MEKVKDKYHIEVNIQRKKDVEILWFNSVEDGERNLLGCISNYEQTKNDFRWLFHFIANLHWKFDIFSDCEVEEKEERWDDEWDSYCETTITHKFSQCDSFVTFIGDLNNSENCNIRDVFKFVRKVTGIDMYFK